MAKQRLVYFNEYNLLMGNTTYLPLVSGLLHAHALTSETVKANYTFAPYLFHIDSPERILGHYEQDPTVAAFSMLMWNEQLNLRVAREVKHRYPRCVIVVGGANVPHHPEAFFRTYPFIDVAVRGEGEEAFTEVLERLTCGGDLEGLPGVSWRTPAGEVRISEVERPFIRDLDFYPSPYLDGLYDDLVANRRDINFQAIIETNRGCPFHCTFCYWGKGGLSRKYRYHGVDRVFAEIQWIGEHNIRYLFNADSNFGMNPRDLEIAELLVATKKRYGFPEKFRTCYGKNTSDRIFDISTLFHEHQLEKGITISYQSIDPQVQKNIKRDNIKIDMARDMHRRCNQADVPVYTELILALPGESAHSWVKGVDEILASGIKNQLFVYCCQVFANTDLGDPAYQKEFGIVTKRIMLHEIHGSVRPPEWVPEYEDVVVQTDALPNADWRRMLAFSWMVMVMHSLKLGFFVMSWLAERFGVRYSAFILALLDAGHSGRFPRLGAMTAIFDTMIERIMAGEGRGCILPNYGKIYWDVEEAAFLKMSEDFPAYFAELGTITTEFLAARGGEANPAELAPDELADVLRYQALRIPEAGGVTASNHHFTYDLPNWFDRLFDEDRPVLTRTPSTLEVLPREFGNNLERFARETILWGRKSGTMLTNVRYP